MNRSRPRLFCLLLALFVPWLGLAQTVNSGSNGSDGAFHPTQSTVVVDMADHPDGIYHYTSVNIPPGVAVSFIPNARNTPVVWLVQESCTIAGDVTLSPDTSTRPGGYPGGNIGGGGARPGDGAGPGGGMASGEGLPGNNASYATRGATNALDGLNYGQINAGYTYGNRYCFPLLGGSGGGGSYHNRGGHGGGALLIAATSEIVVHGSISAAGGNGYSAPRLTGGAGSGGAIRLVATRISGNGSINVSGGQAYFPQAFFGANRETRAGDGWIRLDALENTFSGQAIGEVSRGYQPIIIPPANQAFGLTILSIGSAIAPPTPSGATSLPDVLVPAQNGSSLPVVVRCSNIPLNTTITVTATPANGPAVSATGLNSAGTLASSTATILLNLPRGSGLLMAKASVAVAPGGVGGQASPAAPNGGLENPPPRSAGSVALPVRSPAKLSDLPYSVTGLTTDGERIATVEVEATLGGGSRTVYVTESGKRLPAPTGK